MSRLRVVRALPLALALLLGAAVPGAQAAAPVLPETVVVHDGRTSPAAVDISQVRLDASWYWDSEQTISVAVPGGVRPGQRLTVWFDLDGDSTPDGHYLLRLGKPVKAGSTSLTQVQEFRRGGGWSLGGTPARCTGSEGQQPASGYGVRGQRRIDLAMDLWSCAGVRTPVGSGAWRIAVALSEGTRTDTAPDRRGWSRPAAGWGPCDPSGGSC